MKQKRTANLIVLAVLLLSLTACVQTPESEAIVNKKDSILESVIQSETGQALNYPVPSHWTETIDLSFLSIEIDADVMTRENMTHPVWEIQKMPLTQEQVYNMLIAFAPGCEIRTNLYNRIEIEEEIAKVLQGEICDSDDDTGEIWWQPYIDEAEQLAYWEDLATTAPEEDTYVPLTPSLLQGDNAFNVIRDKEGKLYYVQYDRISVQIAASREQVLQPESLVNSSGGLICEKPHPLEKVAITEEQAIQTAQSYIDSILGGDAYGIGEIEKARTHRFTPWLENTYTIDSEGWLIHVSYCGGVYQPYPYASFSTDGWANRYSENDEPNFAPRWYPEHLTLYVTEHGIERIFHSYLRSIVEITNANVSILPFEQIQTRIRDQLRYNYSWVEDRPDRRLKTIHVKKILLSCAIVPKENSTDTAYLCPTWVIVLNNNHDEGLHFPDSLLLINAIDGSVVNWP